METSFWVLAHRVDGIAANTGRSVMQTVRQALLALAQERGDN